MNTLNPFDIIRISRSRNISLILPAGAAKRGTAYQDAGGTSLGTAELADGTKPLAGFVTREVKASGPTLNDVVFEDYLQPFRGGQEGSLEKFEELEVEGTDYIDASITSGTALQTDLSFTAGKLGTKGGGQIAFYRLSAVITDPALMADPANTLRIRVCAVNP